MKHLGVRVYVSSIWFVFKNFKILLDSLLLRDMLKFKKKEKKETLIQEVVLTTEYTLLRKREWEGR